MTTEMWVTLALAAGSYLLHAYQAYRNMPSATPATPAVQPVAASPATASSTPASSQTPSSQTPPGHVTIGHGELINLLLAALQTPPPATVNPAINLSSILAAAAGPASPAAPTQPATPK